MQNEKAFRMIEGRFSEHVKQFNAYPVTDSDSDLQEVIVKERLELARAALGRVPVVRVTSTPRSLGDAYAAVRKGLSEAERVRWDERRDTLDALERKYGM